LDDADPVSVEDAVEGSGELGVAIADQEPELLGAVGEVHQQVALTSGACQRSRVRGVTIRSSRS
jgi:hypothetical protein